MARYEDFMDAGPAFVKRHIDDRQRLQRVETENFLRTELLVHHETLDSAWQWNYTDEAAYDASLRPWREHLVRTLGVYDLNAVNEPETEEVLLTDDMRVYELRLPFRHHFTARALLALPADTKGPFPLVVAQHGIDSSPERVLGFGDADGGYAAFGRQLVQQGVAVLAPVHITDIYFRSRYNRLCLLQGKTLWGLEIAKLKCLLDAVTFRPDIDDQRIGMWGISLGGAYTIFTVPIEPRIQVAVITAWFNDRLRKMIIDDPRHSCFLSTKEEYAFIPGWLQSFRDSDLVSMICPRPLMIQTGKADNIAWWPWVSDEFERSRMHYERLDAAQRLVFDLHEGGHSIHLQTGLDFMRRYL